MAEKTIEKFLARAVWLYEQDQGESFGSPRFGLYVRQMGVFQQPVSPVAPVQARG
jgi:hypothetical protein